MEARERFLNDVSRTRPVAAAICQSGRAPTPIRAEVGAIKRSAIRAILYFRRMGASWSRRPLDWHFGLSWHAGAEGIVAKCAIGPIGRAGPLPRHRQVSRCAAWSICTTWLTSMAGTGRSWNGSLTWPPTARESGRRASPTNATRAVPICPRRCRTAEQVKTKGPRTQISEALSLRRCRLNGCPSRTRWDARGQKPTGPLPQFVKSSSSDGRAWWVRARGCAVK